MKKIYFPLILLIVLVLVGVGVFVWWKENSAPVSTAAKTQTFTVEKGDGASTVAATLYQKGLIRSPLAFKIYIQIRGESGDIKPGDYEISPAQSLRSVIATLINGPTEVWVTVPEGLRREEIAAKFVQGLGLKQLKAESFTDQFLQSSLNLEGYLFPDTYLVPKNLTGIQAVTLMKKTFDQKTARIVKNSGGSSFNLSDTVILASLIERESRDDSERAIVSGIIIKRLKAGMALQIDATVQYAIAGSQAIKTKQSGNWWPRLTLADLKFNSPYNTYLNQGLPPTAIANPGLSSIQAAVNPQDSPYWYYLHDSSGQIHYAKTLEEHDINIRKYLGG